MAFYVARWNRGVLPVAAALAIILLIFAAVAGPAWFERDKTGFTDPALDASLLGLITLLIVPVQALLIVFAMQAFSQEWNVEVERRSDGSTDARACRRLTYPVPARPGGGTGRRDRPQKPIVLRACGFESRPGHLSGPRWHATNVRSISGT